MCPRASKKAGVPGVEQTQRRQAGGQGGPSPGPSRAPADGSLLEAWSRRVKLSDFVFKKALSWLGGEWIAQRQGWIGGSRSPRE